MKHKTRWITATFVVLCLLLAACGSGSGEEKVPPSKLEPIEGSDYQRVVITQKAAERLGIQTVPLTEEEMVRTRTVGGKVVSIPETVGGPVWAQVSMTKSGFDQVDRDLPTLVLALNSDDEEEEEEDRGWPAEPDEGPNHDDEEDVDLPGEDLIEELYYLIDSPEHGLEVGQAVLVELTLAAQETLRKVVPYQAVLYGVHGETWVYSESEPLVYVRLPIVIDYIEGDLAYLSAGPEVGTAVVTVGAAELFGTETGVSK